MASRVEDALRDGMSLFRRDPAAADAAFRAVLARDASALPAYFCLYKIHAYQGHFDEALGAAYAGLAEAARQADLADDWRAWTRDAVAVAPAEPARFALYTLKALAFIHLRRGQRAECRQYLLKLEELDAMHSIGGSVVADLERGIA